MKIGARTFSDVNDKDSDNMTFKDHTFFSLNKEHVLKMTNDRRGRS